MPCNRVGNAIVCTRGPLPYNLGVCQQCWVARATKLCDGPRALGSKYNPKISGADKTCSKPLCARCAHHEPPDHDYCATHADPAKRRLAL